MEIFLPYIFHIITVRIKWVMIARINPCSILQLRPGLSSRSASWKTENCSPDSVATDFLGCF